LSSQFINKKIEAISQYKSQIIKYDNRDAIKGLASLRGLQVNNEYAECFEVMRIII
jgi:hypothetical protein